MSGVKVLPAAPVHPVRGHHGQQTLCLPAALPGRGLPACQTDCSGHALQVGLPACQADCSGHALQVSLLACQADGSGHSLQVSLPSCQADCSGHALQVGAAPGR